MTETLTESFCERCGTRYEFQAPTRLNSLRKTRGFIGGLRNYLTSQDALSDAMGDAMRSEEATLATAQLDAFHESFNFCIDCRQYTCVNCWNDAAGRCRSCVPIPGTDDLVERLAAAHPAAIPGEWAPAETDVSLPPRPSAWPTSDVPAEGGWSDGASVPMEMEPAAAGPGPDLDQIRAEASAEWVAAGFEPEPQPWTVVPDDEPEPTAAEAEPEPTAAEAEPQPWPIAADAEPEPAFEAEPVRAPLRVVAWDEDGAYEQFEPERAPTVAAEEPEPVMDEVAVEPVAAVEEGEPQSVAVEDGWEPVTAEDEPQPVALDDERQAAPAIAPIHQTILHFPTRAPSAPMEDDKRAAAADAPEVAARRAQLDLLGLGDPGQGPVAPERPQALPYRSRGSGVAGSAELARAAALRGATFWEASAREVAGASGHVGVQNCGQCGLSLSANARFCRRCGTRQAQSA